LVASAISFIKNLQDIIFIELYNSFYKEKKKMAVLQLFDVSEEQTELANSLIEELGLKERVVNEIQDELTLAFDENRWIELKLLHLGEPKASPRPRMNSRLGIMYDSSKGLKQSIIEQIQAQLPRNFKPFSKQIIFNAKCFLTVPKSFGKKDQVLAELGIIRPLKKPDKDNLDKLIYDALLKVLYTDDSIIVGGNTDKYYSCKPRTELTLYIEK
jgi:Holliday junction resolvase RusA-like endonuclease